MKFKCIVSEFSSNCYLIEKDDSYYLIDPSISVDKVKSYIDDKKICGILITHAHIDHIYFLEEILKEYDCPVYMSKFSNEFLKDTYKNCSKLFGINKTFNVGNKNLILLGDNDLIDNFIKVHYTPGHTIDSLCFEVENKLFTGDTLFKGSIGRTDFYSGDYNMISDSIKKLYSFKKNFNIFPGHGLSSTFVTEEEANYYVKMMKR